MCEAPRYAGFCARGCPRVTVIPLGRGSPHRLGATYPPAPRDHIDAGLFGIAARRDCPFHPSNAATAFAGTNVGGLVSVALILTSRWTGVTCYAALCSPDVPPVRPFGDCTSDGLEGFTPRLSQACKRPPVGGLDPDVSGCHPGLDPGSTTAPAQALRALRVKPAMTCLECRGLTSRPAAPRSAPRSAGASRTACRHPT
ncbi:MAG: hypothetical protein JWP60_1027 [Ramlibacter sp.]|nr:hypothetical protein [Ramlibacter sp.]